MPKLASDVLRDVESRYLLVVIALDPRHQAQPRENLRLDAQRNVEFFNDIVNA